MKASYHRIDYLLKCYFRYSHSAIICDRSIAWMLHYTVGEESAMWRAALRSNLPHDVGIICYMTESRVSGEMLIVLLENNLSV